MAKRVFYRAGQNTQLGPFTVVNSAGCQNSTNRPSAAIQFNINYDPGLRVQQTLASSSPWGLSYNITGQRSTGAYCPTKINVKTFNQFCQEQFLVGANGVTPVNEWFWFCAVDQAPQVSSGQTISGVVGVNLSQSIQLNSPLLRIPETVTASGLPAGLSLSFNTEPAYEAGVLQPTDYLPVISGVPQTSGTFTVSITSTNLVGSTTVPVTIAIGTPSINTSTPNLSGFSTNQGIPSQSQSVNVSGSGLAIGITLSAPVNFEVSSDNAAFQQSLTINPTNGAVNTTAYVRVAATAPVGAVSGNLTLSSTGATNKSVSLSGTVDPALTRPVTFSVNMNNHIALGQFNTATDRVEVRGVFNNWTGTDLSDDNADGIYSVTIVISGSPGTVQNFKFFVPTNNLSWETGADRTFTLGAGNTAQILDVVYFNNFNVLPPLLLGTSRPATMYVGGISVARIHLGETQIYP